MPIIPYPPGRFLLWLFPGISCQATIISSLRDTDTSRLYQSVFALFVAAAGLTAGAFLNDPTAKMVAFSVAGFGIFGSLPVFWTLPTAFLSGTAAAGGIAIINSIGNLAGFVGPSVMGMIKDATGSFTNGLLVLVGVALVALVIVLLLPHETALERVPELDTSRTRETPRTPASP